MDKQEIINGIKKHGMEWIHLNFCSLSPFQASELILSAIYVIGNNNLDDEYFKELEGNL